jgi:hypothetical protein
MQPDIVLLQKQAETRVKQAEERSRRLCERGPFFEKEPVPAQKPKGMDDRFILLLLLLFLMKE